MNGYGNFQQPQRPFLPHNNASNMMDMSGDGMNNFGMVDGQSLDDIVSQNEKANRRRSMPVYAGGPMQMGSPDSRRLSMMNFGDMGDTNYGDFQFSMPSEQSMESMMRSNTFPRSNANGQMDSMPAAELSVNTQYSNQNTPFSNLADPGSAYASPLPAGNSLDMEMNLASPYPPNAAGMQFDLNDPSLNTMGTDMNMFPSNQFTGSIMDSPVGQDFSGPLPQTSQDNTMNGISMGDQFGNTPVSTKSDLPSGELSRPGSHEQSSQRSASRQQSEPQSAQGISHGPTASFGGGEPINMPPTQDPSMGTDSFNQNDSFGPLKFPWTTPTGGFPSSRNNNTHMNTQFKNAYSSTGFDMLGVLMRVATRQNPDIDIGSVDLSCAFVVCDAQEHDCPIVYCSENFERLTGYTKHMILGRNCRFLQSPDGKVEPGIKRKYVDDDSVLYLKNTISARKEAQISLINYRRGGQPFMNLLTMIPIAWEPGQTIKFIVGFQVDLVEQPSAMTNRNSDGSYRVNYQRGMSMPSYVFNPDAPKMTTEVGQTISKDEVSNVLATYGQTGDSEITRRLWDKVLLENTDDVVFVLSLKGLYLYLSPSSKRVLEYEASELVGTALSSVCHPSDIVPVTRELKESGNGASVNVVFRIRRKKSGYMWFEGHGSLHTEQGKGRKCIILVGRERPVYTLGKTIVRASGGIGDNELWSKMSTSGMFLFVSSNVRQLLDRQPEDLVGTSIQALMRQDSKQNFGRILELARGGRTGEVKHEMINKRGQVLQAFTTIYPGDATEGQKPTFVVGQTRLLKYSRSSQTQRPSMYQSKERNSGDSTTSSSMIPSASPLPAPSLTGNTGSNTPLTVASDGRFMTTEAQPTTFAGQQGLAIGHQDQSLASEENIFDELKTTRSTSWQYELRQMEKRNRYLAEEVQSLLAAKKKRKRRKGAGQMQKDCANCHTRTTPEWRRGPSGNRDLCNSCGLRWAKQNGRVSPRASSQSDKSKKSASPRHNPSILPNVVPEAGTQSSIPSSMVQPGRKSPQQASDNTHTAKAVRMEAVASQGYGHSSAHSTHMQPPNIPSRIDEGTEPT